jgi:hypothetical protein
MRHSLQEVSQRQLETGSFIREAVGMRSASDDASVLQRAMASTDAASVFAEAATQREPDPLTDPDARLWVGLLP